MNLHAMARGLGALFTGHWFSFGAGTRPPIVVSECLHRLQPAGTRGLGTVFHLPLLRHCLNLRHRGEIESRPAGGSSSPRQRSAQLRAIPGGEPRKTVGQQYRGRVAELVVRRRDVEPMRRRLHMGDPTGHGWLVPTA
jgi:hypothetical protein